MKNIFRALCCCTLFAASAAHAELQNTNPFKTAFAAAFWLEACGDHPMSETLMKAVTDKVDHCPFSAAAKQEFHQWSETTRTRMAAQLEEYKAAHGGTLPDRLDGMKMSCSQYRQTPNYVKMSDQLALYAQGKTDVDSVITDPCDTGAAPH